MRPVEIFLAENPRLLLGEDLGADDLSDPVIGRVAQDRGRGQDEKQPADLEGSGRGERSGGEDEGIPRKEGGDDQAGFTENHHKKETVCPAAEHLDQTVQVLVQMEDEIDGLRDQFHEDSFDEEKIRLLPIWGP